MCLFILTHMYMLKRDRVWGWGCVSFDDEARVSVSLYSHTHIDDKKRWESRDGGV